MRAPTNEAFGAAWIADYFEEVDRMDPDALMRWYTGNGAFRFAGQPRVIGKSAIAKVLASFYGSIRAMRHERTGVWVDEAGQTGVWEAEVHFTTRDERRVIIPAVSVLRLRDGLVADFRFVMDATPLQATAP